MPDVRGQVGTHGGADWHDDAANPEVGHGERQHEERREVLTKFGVPRDQNYDETVRDNVHDDVDTDVDRLYVGTDDHVSCRYRRHVNCYVDNVQ